MLRIIIAVALLGHGIGHSMGLLKVANIASVNPKWRGDSWILTRITGQSVTTAAGVALWSSAMVGFTAAAGAVLGWLPVEWFQPLAVVSCVVSLLGVLLFPIAFPTFSTIGAVAANVVVLVAVVWYDWMPSDLGA